jgi:hypothetical protein
MCTHPMQRIQRYIAEQAKADHDAVIFGMYYRYSKPCVWGFEAAWQSSTAFQCLFAHATAPFFSRRLRFKELSTSTPVAPSAESIVATLRLDRDAIESILQSSSERNRGEYHLVVRQGAICRHFAWGVFDLDRGGVMSPILKIRDDLSAALNRAFEQETGTS